MLFVVLIMVPMSGYLYGLVLAFVTALVGAVGLLWPDLLGLAAFGCEPAAVILGVLLGSPLAAASSLSPAHGLHAWLHSSSRMAPL